MLNLYPACHPELVSGSQMLKQVQDDRGKIGIYMSPKGFTFLEVIVVLAIIGILSVLAVSDISAFTGRLRLETTARNISTDLREIKMKAVLDRSNYTIYFDTINKLYELPGRRTLLPSEVRFGFSSGVLGPPGNPVQTPDGDGVTFPSNRVNFYAQGSNSMGTVYITNDDLTMALSLTITGRVKIWRWDGEKWG